MIEENKKPKAKIIGADGNVFNLMGICSRALKDNGYEEESKVVKFEMQTYGYNCD